MLENIGYVCLPPGLLDKEGPLGEEDWEHVDDHPRYGATMLVNAGLDAEVLGAIEQHHERWSGSGYPHKRKGQDITLFARIIALADIYHSLLSRRPQRAAFRPHEAIEFLVAYSGDLLDPELVHVFAGQIPQYPAGLVVRLSSGEVGIVSDPNVGQLGRPVVRVCVRDGQPLKHPYDLDLSGPDCMTTLIVGVLL
jgi:HD-GYP domain-containing protein (c-di-GMP phosphodiesterase class II)